MSVLNAKRVNSGLVSAPWFISFAADIGLPTLSFGSFMQNTGSLIMGEWITVKLGWAPSLRLIHSRTNYRAPIGT